MPFTKTITDPRLITEQLVKWLDEPAEDDGYDGFDIDLYDDERERGA